MGFLLAALTAGVIVLDSSGETLAAEDAALAAVVAVAVVAVAAGMTRGLRLKFVVRTIDVGNVLIMTAFS